MEETRPERTSEQQTHIERLQAEVERLEAEEAKRKHRWETARSRVKERMQRPSGGDSDNTLETPPPDSSPGPIESRPALGDLEIHTPSIERIGRLGDPHTKH